MATIAALDLLKQSLSSGAAIVTPTSENYTESIMRWATSAERPAVCSLALSFHVKVSSLTYSSRASSSSQQQLRTFQNVFSSPKQTISSSLSKGVAMQQVARHLQMEDCVLTLIKCEQWLLTLMRRLLLLKVVRCGKMLMMLLQYINWLVLVGLWISMFTQLSKFSRRLNIY